MDTAHYAQKLEQVLKARTQASWHDHKSQETNEGARSFHYALIGLKLKLEPLLQQPVTDIATLSTSVNEAIAAYKTEALKPEDPSHLHGHPEYVQDFEQATDELQTAVKSCDLQTLEDLAKKYQPKQ
ncbi:MAG TPA: hypothetical protein VLJ21_00190 [Candidatus Binatia bacterium]|nr:hypothetical protein [Candidatus Binatia bacterium]